VLHRAKGEKISYVQQKEGRLNGLVTSLRRNCLLKHVFEGTVEGRI